MKKIIICLLIILISTAPAAYALECEFVGEEQFNTASDFIKGIAIVSKDFQTAVIDRHGNYVVDFDERIKHIRGNGLIMIVGENDLGAFFDKKGNQLTDYVYDTYPVTDAKWRSKTYNLLLNDGDGKSDLVPFSRGKKFGYINPYGTEVIAPVFEYAYGFYNGIARICADGILSEYGTYTNGKYGFIKDNGEVIVPPDSYWVASYDYDGGYSLASNGNGSEIITDRHGNVSHTDEIGYGSIDVKYINVKDTAGRTGVVDRSKNTVIPLDFYHSIDYLNGDWFIVNKKYIVNNMNQITYTAGEGVNINPHYLGVIDKSMYARLSKEAGDTPAGTIYGLVSCYGDIIMDIKYKTLYDLGEGLIYAQNNGKNYLFDYFGNMLCELNGNNPGRSVDGVFSITDFDTMKKRYMLNPLLHPKVYVDGEKLISDVYPKIENSRTLIPMRAVFEALGATVEWEDETQTVLASKGDINISLQIGSNILYKNGETTKIDVPAKLEEDRTLIPLRAVSEALGAEVKWDEEKRVVDIVTNHTE